LPSYVTSRDFTLKFFAEGGQNEPLSVPLLLSQTGATTTTSALTQTLAPGAMLVVTTQADAQTAAVAGSAQLTTTGSISGFEIFCWTTFGQETSVPPETRSASTYELIFDNTNGLLFPGGAFLLFRLGCGRQRIARQLSWPRLITTPLLLH